MTVDERTEPSGSLTTAPVGGDRPDEETELAVGAVVDRYVVVARLGSGTGGVVYSAFDSHLGRRVALKVLRTPEDPNDSPGWRRLVHEAQLVARLDHAHVVTVHDVGLTDGLAFIAMELVDGTDLAQWLLAEQAPSRPSSRWRKRLEPLLAAGKGLAAAHGRQVIHGDFKPANVLLGRDGKIRVTDFGVARLHENCPESPAADDRTFDTTAGGGAIDDWSTLDEARTRPGGLWGTPLYMAPELFDGGRPTIASDIYSFSASLYEALYGELPARGRSLMSLYASKLEPKQPPGGCGVPRRVRDVVLRGLHPDPSARPVSITEMLTVIERSLRPRTRSWGWVAGSVAVASGFAAVGAYAWQDRATCSHAREHLAGVWDEPTEAKLQQAILELDAPFAAETWQRVDAELDAYAQAWVDTHTRTCLATQRGTQSEALLDVKMACLDARRAEVSALIDVLAEGEPDVIEAATAAVLDLRPPDECGALQKLSTSDDALEVSRATSALTADLARARSLASAGRLDASDALAQAVLKRARQTGHRRTEAEALHRLGNNAAARPGSPNAQDTLQEAIWVAETHHVDDVAAWAGVDLLWTLAGPLSLPKEALQWAPHVEVAIKRARLGAEARAKVHHSRATALIEMGRYDEGLAELGQMGEHAEQAADSRGLLAMRADALGRVHHERGENELALARHREALQLREQLYGPNHPLTASTMHNVANVLANLRRFDESLELQRRSLAILRAGQGSDHPNTITAEADLAAAYAELDRLEEAEATYQRAVEALARVHGKDHLHYGAMLLNLAGVQGRLQRYEEAAANAGSALPVVEARVGEEHPWVAFGLINQGTALNHLQRYDEARLILERAMGILERHPADPQHTAMGRFALAKAIVATDDDARARRRARVLGEQALATWEEVGADEYAEDVRRWLDAQ